MTQWETIGGSISSVLENFRIPDFTGNGISDILAGRTDKTPGEWKTSLDSRSRWKQQYGPSYLTINDLAFTDLDGDHHTDLLAIVDSTLSISYADWSQWLPLNDLTLPANTEIVFANAARILTNDQTSPRPTLLISHALPSEETPGVITITGTLPNAPFDVEYSEDLITWQVIAEDVESLFEDTESTRLPKPAGYYRWVLSP